MSDEEKTAVDTIKKVVYMILDTTRERLNDGDEDPGLMGIAVTGGLMQAREKIHNFLFPLIKQDSNSISKNGRVVVNFEIEWAPGKAPIEKLTLFNSMSGEQGPGKIGGNRL